MCQWNPDLRIRNFFDVQKEINNNLFFEIAFSKAEMTCYRAFADCMERHLSKIESGAKYVDDLERIKTRLDAAYRSCMLEEFAPDSASILRCFIHGAYYYTKKGFPVSTLRDFLRVIKGCTNEKQRIILGNLHTRLDAISRYSKTLDDDVPF
jgi:serine/threonine-protein kinase